MPSLTAIETNRSPEPLCIQPKRSPEPLCIHMSPRAATTPVTRDSNQPLPRAPRLRVTRPRRSEVGGRRQRRMAPPRPAPPLRGVTDWLQKPSSAAASCGNVLVCRLCPTASSCPLHFLCTEARPEGLTRPAARSRPGLFPGAAARVLLPHHRLLTSGCPIPEVRIDPWGQFGRGDNPVPPC